jgi:uncharacterized protein (UPF0210 family)
LVQKGITPGEKTLIESLPEALTVTKRICSSFNIGTTKAGINVDAVKLISQKIIETAAATADTQGFGCAKIVVFANMPEDNPFMAGAMLGPGQPECVINVGVSGPGVVKRAIDRMLKNHPDATLNEIAEEIKHTAYRVTLTLEKLEAMTAVCSVGLDMILLPGDTSAETIAGLILDEAAIGITARKTTGVRAIPVPGAKKGDYIDFGGLFGAGTITQPASPTGAETFINRGGHIPAPIHSMLN